MSPASSQWRKKPVVIDAIQFTGRNYGDVNSFLSFNSALTDQKWDTFSDHIIIHTLEGDMRADVGDWIIRGVRGEYYPCKPGIFAATYQPVVHATVPLEIERAETVDLLDLLLQKIHALKLAGVVVRGGMAVALITEDDGTEEIALIASERAVAYQHLQYVHEIFERVYPGIVDNVIRGPRR